MRSRILSVFIVIAMLMSLAVNVYAENEETYDSATDFMRNLGTVNGVEFAPDNQVTRGEFAAILVNLMRENETAAASGNMYNDVNAETPYAAAIEKITSMGYMHGVSDNMFIPEHKIILIHAVKVLADMLGCGMDVANGGGYDEGYKKTAQRYGMTKGIDKSYEDTITQKDLARLIYNILDVEIVQEESTGIGMKYTYDKNKTFLTEILKLNRVNGIMSDNGITSLYGESTLGEKNVKIADTEAAIADNALYVKSYIGCNVTAYITNDEDLMLMYAAPNTKNSIETFDIKDFVSYDVSSVKFDNGNGRTLTKNLADDTVMIYNGVAKPYFGKEDFLFTAGTVKLISNNSSSFNVIVIEKHDYMRVQSVDYDKEIIYSSLLDSNRKAYQIDLGKYDYVTVTNANGEAVEINSIAPGNVIDAMVNAPNAEIKILDSKLDNFKPINSYEENGYTYISDGENQYRFLPEYIDSPYSTKLKIGQTYTIYTAGDIIIWAETSAEAAQAGFLIESFYDTMSEDGFVKIFGQDGKITKYSMNDKIVLTDTDGKKSTYKCEAFYGKTKDYHSIVKYKTNDEGKITELECATDKPNTNGQLYKIFDRRETPYGWTGDGGFQGLWFYNSSTVFMKVPNNLRDDSYYKIVNESTAVDLYEKNRSRISIAFTTKPNSAIAEYVLFMEPESGESTVVGSDRTMVVVDSILTAVDEDNDLMQVIQGTAVKHQGTVKKRVEIFSKFDAVQEANGETHSAFQKVRNTLGTTDENGVLKTYDIQPGDIIRCIYSEDNKAEVADLLWRPSIDNPTSTGGKKGFLVGSTGYSQEGVTNGNPFSIDTNGNQMPYSPNFSADQTGRFVYGFVLKKEGGIIHMTTADLSDPSVNPNNIGSNFVKYNVNINAGPIIIADYSSGKAVSKPGNMDDIRTYEEAGNECSRIIISSHWGVYPATVIINGGSY